MVRGRLYLDILPGPLWDRSQSLRPVSHRYLSQRVGEDLLGSVADDLRVEEGEDLGVAGADGLASLAGRRRDEG